MSEIEANIRMDTDTNLTNKNRYHKFGSPKVKQSLKLKPRQKEQHPPLNP